MRPFSEVDHATNSGVMTKSIGFYRVLRIDHAIYGVSGQWWGVGTLLDCKGYLCAHMKNGPKFYIFLEILGFIQPKVVNESWQKRVKISVFLVTDGYSIF